MPFISSQKIEVQMSQAAQASTEEATPERALKVAPKPQSKSPSAIPYPNWSRFMKSLIKKTNKSGSQIADEIKVSQTQVSRWTRGLARPATLDKAIKMVAKVGGDVEAAQAAFNSDPSLPRGRAAASARRKPTPAAAKKPGPKPGSTRAAKKVSGSLQRSTPVQPVSSGSSTREVSPPAAGVPADVVLEGISLAQRALVEAEKGIDDAVAAARAAGISWPEIGKALSGA